MTATSRCFQALDSIVSLEADHELNGPLSALLASYPTPDGGARAQLRYRIELSPRPGVWLGGQQRFTTDQPRDLLPLFEQDLYAEVARRCRHPWLLHAAALVRAGRALLLVGPSGVGKSTLCLALAARGASYLSDDCVALRRRGDTMVVRGLRRPIGIDDPEDPVARDLPEGFERYLYQLRGHHGEVRSLLVHPPAEMQPLQDVSVAAVVCLRHAPQRPPACEPLSVGSAIARLWESTLRRDQRALLFASEHLRGCRTAALRTRDVHTACHLLEGMWR